jgi:hypothetical protein
MQMKKNKIITLAIGAFLGVMSRAPLHASVMNIPLPTTAYTEATNVLDAGPQDIAVTSLTDGNLTVVLGRCNASD